MMKYPTDFEEEEKYAEEFFKRERDIDKAEYDRERAKDNKNNHQGKQKG